MIKLCTNKPSTSDIKQKFHRKEFSELATYWMESSRAQSLINEHLLIRFAGMEHCYNHTQLTLLNQKNVNEILTNINVENTALYIMSVIIISSIE